MNDFFPLESELYRLFPPVDVEELTVLSAPSSTLSLLATPELQIPNPAETSGGHQAFQNEADVTQSVVKAVSDIDVHDKRSVEQSRADLAEQLLKGEWSEGARFKCALAMLSCAVDFISAGHVHTDVRPQNMMYDPDTGIARLVNRTCVVNAEDHPSMSDYRDSGPHFYASPEQYWHGEATEETMVYSLGIILLNLFSENPSLFDVAESMPMAKEGIKLNLQNLLPKLREKSETIVLYLEDLFLDMVAEKSYYRPHMKRCLDRLALCTETYRSVLTYTDEIREVLEQFDFLQRQLEKSKVDQASGLRKEEGCMQNETRILEMQYADQHKRIAERVRQYEIKIDNAVKSLQYELDQARLAESKWEQKVERRTQSLKKSEASKDEQMVEYSKEESLAGFVFRQRHILMKVFGALDFSDQRHFLMVVRSSASLHHLFSDLIAVLNVELAFHNASDYVKHDGFRLLEYRDGDLQVFDIDGRSLPRFNTSTTYHVVSIDKGTEYGYFDGGTNVEFVCEDFHLFLIIVSGGKDSKKGGATGGINVGYLRCGEGHGGYDYDFEREVENADLFVSPDWSSSIDVQTNYITRELIEFLNTGQYEKQYLLSHYFSVNKHNRKNARSILISALNKLTGSLRQAPQT